MTPHLTRAAPWMDQISKAWLLTTFEYGLGSHLLFSRRHRMKLAESPGLDSRLVPFQQPDGTQFTISSSEVQIHPRSVDHVLGCPAFLSSRIHAFAPVRCPATNLGRNASGLWATGIIERRGHTMLIHHHSSTAQERKERYCARGNVQLKQFRNPAGSKALVGEYCACLTGTVGLGHEGNERAGVERSAALLC